MESQEMESYVKNHPLMKYYYDCVISSINEIYDEEKQRVEKGERKPFDNSPYTNENGVKLRPKAAYLSEFRDKIDDGLEPLSNTISLDNIEKLKKYFELLEMKLESKIRTEYLTGNSSVEFINKLLDEPRANLLHFNLLIGDIIKISAVDSDNMLLNSLEKALNTRLNIGVNNVAYYIVAIREIAQYDNFGIFRRDNKDLIMNPTPDNIKKLTENINAFKLKEQQKKANKIIPKEKNEENKIIPKEPNEKNKSQEEIKKQDNVK